MKKAGHVSVYDALYTMLRWFACLCCIMLLYMNFAYTTEISYDMREVVTILNRGGLNLAMFTFIAISVLFCEFFHGGARKVTEKRIFLILTTVYLVMSVYLIFFIDPSICADALSVFSASREVLDGNFHSFYKEYNGYLYMHPHQIGLMLYDMLLSLIWASPVFNYFMNFLFVIGINYLTYRTANSIFHNKRINILAIICSFAFLPQFFFIIFAYGLIPGFFFLMLAFYNITQYVKGHKVTNLIWVIIGTATAVVLKQNYLIGGIAVIIYLLLDGIHQRKNLLNSFLVVILILVCMILPSRLLTFVCESVTGATLDSGMPSVLWVAMGTDIDNTTVRGPGWIDASNYHLYYTADQDKAAATALGKEKLAENMEKIRQEPGRSIHFFTAKIISQWCDPLYQSVWSGLPEIESQWTHTKLLHSLYNDGLAESCVSVICKMLNLLLWPCICYFLFLCHRKTADWTLMYLYCIGGLIFHTFWEAKSQYIYPYVFCLIPFAMYALDQILSKISVFCQNLQKRAQIRH